MLENMHEGEYKDEGFKEITGFTLQRLLDKSSFFDRTFLLPTLLSCSITALCSSIMTAYLTLLPHDYLLFFHPEPAGA